MTASVSEEELERLEAENRAASSWGASLATPVPGAVSNAMVEAFDMAHALIQEAKGFEERGGPITDHLDAAENWLNVAQALALEAAVQSPPIEGEMSLEWKRKGSGERWYWSARCPTSGALYEISTFDRLFRDQVDIGHYPSLDPQKSQAKAAAQADYETRVRSALEAVATEPVAWRWQVLPREDYFCGIHYPIGADNITPLHTAPTGDSRALREALADMLARFKLYAGENNIHAGQHDKALIEKAEAALSGEPGK
jgi:hypothetical protein